MYIRHELGKIGEDIATKYLIENDYEIIERNFRCKQGEIDIIAKNKTGKEYIFIEVKTRSGIIYGRPSEAVNNIKQKHIIEATKYYLYLNKLEDKYIRLDIIEVYNNKGKLTVNHIKQAF